MQNITLLILSSAKESVQASGAQLVSDEVDENGISNYILFIYVINFTLYFSW